MDFGLIGETLGHSYSPQIHRALGSTPYELRPLAREELDSFLRAHDFRGINVTIPYKQAVIPYLTDIDPSAARIGAVNTVTVSADGGLHGYNTDYAGMKYALSRAGIDPYGKKAVILGTGGTSKTARCVLTDLGVSEIVLVSRRAGEVPVEVPDGAGVSDGTGVSDAAGVSDATGVPDVTGVSGGTGVSDAKSVSDASHLTRLKQIPVTVTDYAHAAAAHADAQILINTTPVGMFPDCGGRPVDLTSFPELEGVMDVVYNPLRTALIMQAESHGIPCTGGLPMLVAQAKAAAEYFLSRAIPDTEIDRILDGLLEEMENIILIGMPGSGKTLIGQSLSITLGREFVDLDECIERKAGMSIPEIFEKYGEKYFRDLESEAVKEEGAVGGRILATGGGVVLREENYAPLHQNGYIVQLRRELSKLPLTGRPLSRSPEALASMEKIRAPYYERFADAVIDNNGTVGETSEQILTLFERR